MSGPRAQYLYAPLVLVPLTPAQTVPPSSPEAQVKLTCATHASLKVVVIVQFTMRPLHTNDSLNALSNKGAEGFAASLMQALVLRRLCTASAGSCPEGLLGMVQEVPGPTSLKTLPAGWIKLQEHPCSEEQYRRLSVTFYPGQARDHVTRLCR